MDVLVVICVWANVEPRQRWRQVGKTYLPQRQPRVSGESLLDSVD